MPIYDDLSTPRDGRVMNLPGTWSLLQRQRYHQLWNLGYAPSSLSNAERCWREHQDWTANNTSGRAWTAHSRTQVDVTTEPFIILTNSYSGQGAPQQGTPRPARAPRNSDPTGRVDGEPGYNLAATPTGYPSGICRCDDCVRAYSANNGVTWASHGYEAARYHRAPSRNVGWSETAFQYYGLTGQSADHPNPPSRWDEHEMEQPIPTGMLDVINHPLRFMLRRSGRIWSAEMEINNISTRRASQILGDRMARYSEHPETSGIYVSSDVTVDAEIKVSCMRDGSPNHAAQALNTYRTLYNAGARCHVNTGHHVHVDGTRLADLGTEGVDQVITAAWALAATCRGALTGLAASGYDSHRGASTHWGALAEKGFLRSRHALHSERLWYAASSGSDRVATMEYRLPNGTTQPLRAQAHIATALALLDFGERATVDGDEKAQAQLVMLMDKIGHGSLFSDQEASEFLLDACNFSTDAKRALAVSAFTAPMGEKAKRVWEQAAEFPKPLAKMLPEAEKRDAANEKRRKARKKTTEERQTPRTAAESAFDRTIAQMADQPTTVHNNNLFFSTNAVSGSAPAQRISWGQNIVTNTAAIGGLPEEQDEGEPDF